MSRRFKSYLNNFEMKEKGKAEEVEKVASAFFDNLHEPRKLQGERVIAGADSVLMFAPFSNRKQGISGHVFVTNFKIAFVTADKSSYPDGDNNRSSQRNKLLENTDIPLTCVDTIYQVSSGERRRKLIPGNTVSTPTKYLEIHCKDYQIHIFGFKFTPKDQAKQVTDAIAHFSYPSKDHLLFAYEFGQSSQFEDYPSPQYLGKEDWEKELERLQCTTMWRVSDANFNFNISTSLPEYFITPINLLNTDIVKAVAQYVDKRIPTWSYTYVNGASLIRTSYIQPESDFKALEEKMYNAIKQSSGNDKDLFILDLGRICPSLLDIRTSHEKLKSIIMTDSAKDFYSTDSRWFSNLENSQWLHHVSSCLNAANHVVNQIIRESLTVVLKEESGCDMTCLVSCLVQLQLDPEYRTIIGFQSLVQREWIIMGHPFQKRLRLIWNQDPIAEMEQAPLFLLFLDCVWQLLQQFPSSFSFTETYLTSLWDTLHIGLFDTFLFNSCWQRKKFLNEARKTTMSLPSAWDWKFQLGEEQLLLFNNPLYMLRTAYDLDHVVDSAKNALRLSGERLRENRYSLLLGNPPPTADVFALQEVILKPEVTSTLIKLWSQCFLRWIIPAQIVGGGNPSQYMQQCVLAEEVLCLQHKLQLLNHQLQEMQYNADYEDGNHLHQDKCRIKNPRPQSGLLFGSSNYQTTSKHLSTVYITSSFPFSPGVSQHTQHSLICGPLSRYLKDTEIDHDYAHDDDD